MHCVDFQDCCQRWIGNNCVSFKQTYLLVSNGNYLYCTVVTYSDSFKLSGGCRNGCALYEEN